MGGVLCPLWCRSHAVKTQSLGWCGGDRNVSQMKSLLFGGIQAFVVTGGAVPILDCLDAASGVAPTAAAARVTADRATVVVAVASRVGDILLFGADKAGTFGTCTSSRYF